MNEDVIADLKQFIATTVSQQTTLLTGWMDKLEHRIDRMDSRLSNRIDGLKEKIDMASNQLSAMP